MDKYGKPLLNMMDKFETIWCILSKPDTHVALLGRWNLLIFKSESPGHWQVLGCVYVMLFVAIVNSYNCTYTYITY